METRKTFGDRLRQLRGSMTQADLAVALGVSRASVGYYENGTRTPDIEMLSKVAEHFDVSYDYLLGSSDYKNKEEQKDFGEKLENLWSIMSNLTSREKKRVLNLMEVVCNSLLSFSEQDAFRALYLRYFYEIIGCVSVQISQCEPQSGYVVKKNIFREDSTNATVSYAVFRSYMWRDAAIKYICDIYDRLERKLEKATSINLEALKSGNWLDENMKKYNDIWEPFLEGIEKLGADANAEKE